MSLLHVDKIFIKISEQKKNKIYLSVFTNIVTRWRVQETCGKFLADKNASSRRS